MTENFILNNVDFSKIVSYPKNDYLVKQISPRDLFFTSQSMEDFDWNHNRSDFKKTEKRVRNISKVESLISRGATIENIKERFPKESGWIDDAFSNNVIRVYKDFNGHYLHTGDDGRHRSLMAKILDIPLLSVVVVGEISQKIESLASDVGNQAQKSGNVYFDAMTNEVVTQAYSPYSDLLDNANRIGEVYKTNPSQNASNNVMFSSVSSGNSSVDRFIKVLDSTLGNSADVRHTLLGLTMDISSIETMLYTHFNDQQLSSHIIGNLIDAHDYVSKSESRLSEMEQVLEKYKAELYS